MAFNPEPKVAAARDFAEKFDAPQVIIFYTTPDGRLLGYASYGKTRALCAGAQRKADIGFNAIIGDGA